MRRRFNLRIKMLIIAAAGFLYAVPALADTIRFHTPPGNETFSARSSTRGEAIFVQFNERFGVFDSKDIDAPDAWSGRDDAGNSNFKLTNLANFNLLHVGDSGDRDRWKGHYVSVVVPTPESGSFGLLLLGIIGVTTAKFGKAFLRR